MADPLDDGQKLDLDEVVALRQELDDLNEKIRSAEEKKHTVKPKIFKKVKADYEEKAKQILEKLAEKAGPLKEEYERVKENEDGLREKRTAVEEELEEVKFRFSLGEYTKEEHDDLAGEKANILEKLEKDIAEIEKNSNLLMDILKRIRDALEPKEEPARAPERAHVEEPAPEPVPGPVSQATPVVEPPVAPPHVEETFETVEKPAHRPSPTDEERHGVHVMADAVEAEPISELAEAVPEEDAHTHSPLDDIVRELEQEMSVPEEPRAAAREREPGAAAAPGEEAGAPGEESEEEKELKCPKCGFVNMADSWYCEKCGAELLGGSEGGGG